MAHVRIGPPDGARFRESDRGQLLIVAGLVMAVSLVALVVLLNATIYSENVATRGIESADGEALEVRAGVVGGVGETIDAVNRDAGGSADPVDERVEEGVDELADRLASNYVRRGGTTAVDVDTSRMTGGWYLGIDGNETSLANGSGATTYTVAGGVDRTRGFALDLDPESLASDPDTGEAFRVVLDGPAPSEPRTVTVHRDDTASNDGEHVVVVEATGGGSDVTCRASVAEDETASVRLTAERVGGESCVGLWPDELVTPTEPYDLRFENADAADGTAEATVRTTTGSDVGPEPAADHDGLSEAVYDAAVHLSYRTAELRFETTVRVAPGEPHA